MTPAPVACSDRIREIREALSLLFSAGDVVELRALGDGGVHSGYFTDVDVMAERAAAMDVFREVHGVYVTLNEVNPALLSRRANRVKHRLSRSDATTADADIIRRRWLPIDFDPVRPSGVSATDEEHAAALNRAEDVSQWLTERGFPAPVLADSGNGAHLLYAIDLPNDGEATRLVKGCLAVLDAFFSDDVVHCDTANVNAGRIWKCYGTTARKGDNTPERPHRKARIISAPDSPAVVPGTVLQNLAGFIPRSAPDAEQGRRRGSFDLRWWLTFHGIAVAAEKPWQGGTLFVLADCPFSSAHTDGAFAIRFSNGAVFAGCHHDSCGGGTQRWQEFRAMYEPERAARRTKGAQKETVHDDGEPQEVVSSPPLLPEVSPDKPECRKRAVEILTDGDPLAFLLDVFHRDHVGDRTVAECLVMSVASQSVENTAGLHVSISGNSGKGKTHACNAMIRLLPDAYRLKDSVSDKALFYSDDLRPGTVLLFDDVGLSDDMGELLKSATANFREPIAHRTVTRDRQLRVCRIPERCVWWLAKVEAAGDDQVMNRMLTVWIDDSAAQDRAVLEHLKRVEAGAVSSGEDDPDVHVCQAMWEILKGAVRRVKIPFARRICFSAIQNRRNPAMLFDFMKCHALLHVLRRETDADGALVATDEDFVYARRLYGEIHGDVGGQETKLTKNEAAALASIARMGIEVFTIRQLQDALGFSFHQTRRLLHGYTNSKATYAGILDKCPAISLIDATVAEELCGTAIRRRENYFSFDAAQYREWTARTDVWLEPDDSDDDDDDISVDDDDDSSVDDGPGDDDDDDISVADGLCDDDDISVADGLCDDDDTPGDDGPGDDDDTLGDDGPGDGAGGDEVCTCAPAVHPNPGKSAQIKDGQNAPRFSKGDNNIDIYKENSVSVHPNPVTEHHLVTPLCESNCMAVPGESAQFMAKTSECRLIQNSVDNGPLQACTPGCTDGARCATLHADRESAVHLHEPARRQRAGCSIPLPGILDHRSFRRSPVCLGTCAICGGGAAVYHSDEERTSICEGCYARLVREWNKGVGVK